MDCDRSRSPTFSKMVEVGDDIGGSMGSHFVVTNALLLISMGAVSLGWIADNDTSRHSVVFAASLSGTPVLSQWACAVRQPSGESMSVNRSGC